MAKVRGRSAELLNICVLSSKPILLHQELEPFQVCLGCPDVEKYSKHSGKKSEGVIMCGQNEGRGSQCE